MPGDTNSALTFVDGSMSVDCLHENLALNEFTPFLECGVSMLLPGQPAGTS